MRHSKVKLTWDEDDPERIQLTRRTLSRKEIDDNDFRAYIASSESESEGEGAGNGKSKLDREKLRALLLGGGDDMPEGWGNGFGENQDEDADDVDMEVTFAPGLSESKSAEEEYIWKKQGFPKVELPDGFSFLHLGGQARLRRPVDIGDGGHPGAAKLALGHGPGFRKLGPEGKWHQPNQHI